MLNKKFFITIFSIILFLFLFPSNVLSATDKRIEINLNAQRLYAFEGDNLIYDFAVSTGNPWTPTPTGTFYPWIKLRYDRMTGGTQEAGTYYDLSNVPYVMYFYNQSTPKWMGYGLHGTYWHNNFGNPMSHGCVNMQTADAEKIYNWIGMNEEATPIIIYGSTPPK